MKLLRPTTRGSRTLSLNFVARILKQTLPSFMNPNASWTVKSCHEDDFSLCNFILQSTILLRVDTLRTFILL